MKRQNLLGSPGTDSRYRATGPQCTNQQSLYWYLLSGLADPPDQDLDPNWKGPGAGIKTVPMGLTTSSQTSEAEEVARGLKTGPTSDWYRFPCLRDSDNGGSHRGIWV